MAEAQLRQVMQRVDPEELLQLKQRVRELEDELRELNYALRRAEESEEQLRLIEAGLLDIPPGAARSTTEPKTSERYRPDRGALAELYAARRAELTQAKVELELSVA